jgi:tetratricopeptide (TPR) repeat protein
MIERRRSLSGFAIAAAIGIAIATSACGTVGGKPFARAFAEGERAYSAGRFRDAAAAYERAAEIAERDRDRDEALYAAAVARQRDGDLDGALAAFDRLAAADPPGERGVRSAYRAAKIRIDRGEKAKGLAALEALFHKYPDHGQAQRSLRTVLLEIEETKGKAAALAWEESLLPAFEGTRLGEEICYDLGLRKQELGSASAALVQFLSCAERWPYPKGALFDDSLWQASLLHEQLGDYKSAIADLHRLLAIREKSDFNGTYDRPRMPQAQLRIGELHRDHGEHPAARRAFHAVYDEFPRSILRAKALFLEAKVAREDGDDAGSCALARKLIGEFPDSRFARKADETCGAVAADAEALRKAREERRKKGIAEAEDDG